MTDDLRPLLFSIAYRMVGTVGDAEDLVQDALLRLHRARQAGTVVDDERAFLCTVVTRAAIDHLRSARVRREEYVGPWLPEPVATEADDPVHQAELADSLSLAFLTLLERLNPVERAAFLLREVFGYPYEELAPVIERSPDAARQLVSRARRHIDAERARFSADRAEHGRLVQRFAEAVADGDLEPLVELLAADAVAYTDGGGKARAARKPIHGRANVARFLAKGMRTGLGSLRIEVAELNGLPGLLGLLPDGTVAVALALDVAGGQVQALRVVVNPEKLAHLPRAL